MSEAFFRLIRSAKTKTENYREGWEVAQAILEQNRKNKKNRISNDLSSRS